MKTVVTLLLACLLMIPRQGWCGDANEELRGFMVGEYDLIGRRPDAMTTYTGRVKIQEDGATLKITRIIDGKTEIGTAKFDTAVGDDRIPVLRMHFKFEGVQYEGTFLWKTDLDNAFRFTGYIHLPGRSTNSPGLEALFPVREK